jgi:hypothetical protein
MNQDSRHFPSFAFFLASLSLFTWSPEDIACFALFGSIMTCSPAFLPDCEVPLYSDDLTLLPLSFWSGMLAYYTLAVLAIVARYSVCAFLFNLKSSNRTYICKKCVAIYAALKLMQ